MQLSSRSVVVSGILGLVFLTLICALLARSDLPDWNFFTEDEAPPANGGLHPFTEDADASSDALTEADAELNEGDSVEDDSAEASEDDAVVVVQGTPPPPPELIENIGPAAGAPAAEGKAKPDGVGGRLIDIRTGRPIVGARVRASFFRPHAVPEGRLQSVAGTPQVSNASIRSSGEGGFSIAPVLPEDPNIALHVQVTHRDYAPAVFVLHGRSGADGLWRHLAVASIGSPEVYSYPTIGETDGKRGYRQDLEVFMRPTLTLPVRFSDRTGASVGSIPVRVTAEQDGYAFAEQPGVGVALNGRLTRPTEAFVLRTNDAGELRLPFSDTRWRLEVLDPLLYAVYSERGSPTEQRGEVSIILPYQGVVSVEVQEAEISTHRLVDRDKNVLVDTELEVRIGSSSYRVRTDADGRFSVGLIKPPPPMPPPSYRNPVDVQLTVLSVDYRGRSVVVPLPNPSKDLMIPARAAKRLGFRLVRGKADEPTPVVPFDVRSDVDLTPVRFGRDGNVEFSGSLAKFESDFVFRCRGFRQLTIRAPELRAAQRQYDLGDQLLDPGWTREIHVRGSDDLRGARLQLLREEERGEFAQSYLVPPDGRLKVAGLDWGTHDIAIEGPWVRPFAAVYEISESVEDAIVVPLQRSRHEQIWVRGFVPELNAFDAARTMVVERYWRRGQADPIVMPPYPLSIDGLFGSVRFLNDVVRADVSVLSTTEWGAHDEIVRQGEQVLNFGGLRWKRRPRADITFVVENLGNVAPPLRVSVRAPNGREEVARLRVGKGVLHVDQLERGTYTLAWNGTGRREESLGFEVRSTSTAHVKLTATRLPSKNELVEVAIVDARGDPLEGARISAVPAGGEAGGALLNTVFQEAASQPSRPATVYAPITVGAPNEFRVLKDGYLSSTVRLKAREPIPNPIPLHRGVEAIGELLDSDGYPADGSLHVFWRPVNDSPVSIGRGEIEVPVTRGRFRLSGLPSSRHRFQFSLAGASVAIAREWILPEQEEAHDLGKLRLEESRALVGQVRLPDGEPARGASVVISARESAYRFPLRDKWDHSRAEHRTKTDESGQFRLEGLPLETTVPLAIVARLEGYADAVEDPIAWDAPQHELFLGYAAELTLDVGYKFVDELDQYRFALEYREPTDGGEHVWKLGEILPDFFGGYKFSGVRPGAYRVTWGLRDAYEPIAPLWEEVHLPDGGAASLRLRVEGKLMTGRAYLNGARVDKGWMLLTHDPGINGGTRVGRIEDGTFTLVDPPSGVRAWGAVIPEASPQAKQNVTRGEAVPISIPNYNQAVRSGQLDFHYRGRQVELRFAADFLARNQGAFIAYQGYEWSGGRFRRVDKQETITDANTLFQLLEPGVHRFQVRSARDTLILGRTVSLEEKERDAIILVR